MRLKSVYIGHYKDLRDFTLNFDGSSFIDVFVGKNATGKSNLFDVLIEIFQPGCHLLRGFSPDVRIYAIKVCSV